MKGERFIRRYFQSKTERSEAGAKRAGISVGGKGEAGFMSLGHFISYHSTMSQALIDYWPSWPRESDLVKNNR